MWEDSSSGLQRHRRGCCLTAQEPFWDLLQLVVPVVLAGGPAVAPVDTDYIA